MHMNLDDLFCLESIESQIDPITMRIDVPETVDKVIVRDYRALKNMLNDELTVTKQDYCSGVQSHIAPHIRKIVTDWMLEV